MRVAGREFNVPNVIHNTISSELGKLFNHLLIYFCGLFNRAFSN
jgi:hypothetical protein